MVQILEEGKCKITGAAAKAQRNAGGASAWPQARRHNFLPKSWFYKAKKC